MSYPPADDRAYSGYYGRPVSAHGAPEPSSPERIHSSGNGAAYPKGAVPSQSPSHIYPSHEASHGYPPQPNTPMSGSAPYPPQAPQQYYGVPGQAQDPNLPSPPPTSGSRPSTANYTSEGAPIVPVGISGGKMFRCRGFGECDKVFTRSEHLARHVRKHTGERPFPCHCGKAFSRLDNLRQHAATVHADQTQLNEAMLTSLASVHAALSQRANREQRRRGEVVEVPKNAVERPRGDRSSKGPPNVPPAPPGGVYPGQPGYHQPPPGWGAPPGPDQGRPRTAGSWMEYPYVGQDGAVHPPGTAGSAGGYVEDAGPSRRPPSSAGSYPHQGYYEQGPPGSSHGRLPSANSQAGAPEEHVPYPYRPVSSNGREMPVPGHYADSEPPSSAHGPPPHSPMYPQGAVAPGGNWTSPPTPHSGYPPADPSLYPHGAPVPAEGAHPYPPQHAEGQAGYGPPPPGSSGGYYYPPQQGQQGYYPPGQQQFQGNNVQGAQPGQPGYDQRKRRSDGEDVPDGRKHPRSSTDGAPVSGEPRAPGAAGQDPLWLPPAAERRSSLAISALLGSPQQDTRSSRPSTADVAGQAGGYPYQYGAPDERGARPHDPAHDEKNAPKALVAE